MIKRGREPRKGEWSIPGGKVDRGETLQAACARELLEETGVVAEIGGLVEVYEIIVPDFHYVLIDYMAKFISGQPVAADDADEAKFVNVEAALTLVSRDDLRDVIKKSYAIRTR